MLKKLKQSFFTLVIVCIGFTSIFSSVPVFGQNNNTIGFAKCNFTTTSKSESLTPCIRDILTFIFVLGIFLMAFRIAYIGINRFNPLDQNSEAQQIGLVKDVVIGLIFLGAPAMILGALNQGLLNIDILDFSKLTGGITPTASNTSSSTLNNKITPTIVSQSTSGVVNQASATASISGGNLISVNVNNPGSGYLSAPNIVLSGGGGTGAAAVAEISNGKISAIRVTSPGTGYTSAPDVSISGGGNLATTQLNFSDKKVQGVSSLGLSASLTSYQTFDPSTFSLAGINNPYELIFKDLIKVIKANIACNYVFTASSYTKSDCENVKLPEFQSIIQKFPSDINSKLGISNAEFTNFNGAFTSVADVSIKPSGQPTSYTFISNGLFRGLTRCSTNYLTVSAQGYRARNVSTKECGSTLADQTGITVLGPYGPTANTITLRAGTSFNRQLTFLN